MQKENKFNCATLRKIDIEAESILSSHLKKLDAISEDIRMLEDRLKSSAIPFTFIYVVSSKAPYEEIPWGPSLISSYMIYEDQALVWGKNEQGDWRLLLNTYISQDFYIDHEGEKFPDGKKTSLQQSKPLLEVKANTRMAIAGELANFYQHLILGVKADLRSNLIIDQSPELTKASPIPRLLSRNENSDGTIDEKIFNEKIFIAS